MIGIAFGTGIAFLFTAVKLLLPEHSTPQEASAQNASLAAYTFMERTAELPSAVGSSSIETPAFPKDLVTRAKESAERNEDVIGWIRIEGTRVDYPVAQAKDDTYYMTYDIEKNKSEHGAIFLDYRCDAASLRGANIVFGHHMKDGSMFASLVRYKDEAFFESHPLIEFSTLKKTYQWEVFAVFITDPSYDYLLTEFTGSDQYLAFITTMQEKSIYKTAISLSASDDILLLSTCTYESDDARLVVVARRKC